MKSTPFERVKAAFNGIREDRPPRGEVWLGSDILQRSGLEDDLGGRLKLAERLKQDLICISLSENPHLNPSTGYRYFPPTALAEALGATDLFVMAVVDGPFQRLTEKMGLMEVFTGWIREKENLLADYAQEKERVERLIEDCLEHGVQGVVVADDLAGDQSTFLDPKEIHRFFGPFYRQAVTKIHQSHSMALFHSCGNIGKIVPDLVSWGFDGLAAIQNRKNSLLSLKNRYGSDLVLMGGIELEELSKRKLSGDDFEAFKRLWTSLGQNGGFILSSSSGLYSGEFLERIEELYAAL